jgi:dienelactone hydrolase
MSTSPTATTSRRPGAEIVLFHSVLGVRPAVREWADRLRTAGHVVHVPDLYEGEAFDDYAPGFAHVERIGGIPSLIERTHAAVANLPNDLVYAGFSNGSVSAQLLAATRPGARGALLIHGCVPLEMLGAERWPAGVPVQVHVTEGDPYHDRAHEVSLRESVEAAGATFELFRYPGAAHLFADSGLAAEYDAESAELMLERVLEFLRGRM